MTYFPYREVNGQINGIVATTRDITEQEITRNRNQQLLQEKEILLREIHHRVKNNLAVITGLLELQAYNLADETAQQAMRDAVGRIQSMAVLYNRLNQSDTLSELSLRDYLPALLDGIIALFPNPGAVKINTQIEDIPLPVDNLSPLGIILNELATNAMKYAFRGRTGGVITLTAARTPEGIAITFADDGAGLPETVSLEHPSGMGLTLVKMLAKQLNACIQVRREGGTAYSILIPPV